MGGFSIHVSTVRARRFHSVRYDATISQKLHLPLQLFYDMKNMYTYIETGTVTSQLTERIEERVKTIRSREDIEMGYWSINAALQDERFFGEKEGLEKGMEIGREEGMVDTLISLVEKGLLSVTDAAEEAEITEEEFEQRMNRKRLAAAKP